MIRIDLTDTQEVTQLMSAGRFDAVIHAAAAVEGTNTVDGLQRCVESNVRAQSNLVSAALKVGCGRFIFCSSIAVYGGFGAGPSGYREPDARPANVYGWSKRAAEQILDWASELEGGLSSVSLRLAGVHGGGRKDGALYAISSAAKKGTPIALRDPGSRFRWLLIDDLLAEFETLLKAPIPIGHHIFNLASADTLSLLGVAQRVKAICGSASPVEVMGSAMRNEVLNIDRAVEHWGFAPTGLEVFLRAYLDSLPAEA
jgi:nucleoside-diphosphate-sugar epimerase